MTIILAILTLCVAACVVIGIVAPCRDLRFIEGFRDGAVLVGLLAIFFGMVLSVVWAIRVLNAAML